MKSLWIAVVAVSLMLGLMTFGHRHFQGNPAAWLDAIASFGATAIGAGLMKLAAKRHITMCWALAVVSFFSALMAAAAVVLIAFCIFSTASSMVLLVWAVRWFIGFRRRVEEFFSAMFLGA